MLLRKIERSFTGAIIFLVILVWIVPAQAGIPTDQVKEKADKIINILTDPVLQDRKEERKKLIINIIDKMVDWNEIAKRALGFHWKGRTLQERQRFTELFKRLLERSYSDKLELYAGEEIKYEAEKVNGDYATVRTKVVNHKKGIDVSVDFHLIKRGKKWLIYDFFIEGVSAVNNYRVQFNEVIARSSYQELVKKLQSKQEGGS